MEKTTSFKEMTEPRKEPRQTETLGNKLDNGIITYHLGCD